LAGGGLRHAHHEAGRARDARRRRGEPRQAFVAMKRSTERFLTTHTGSLPRPDDLIRMMFAREEGVPVDAAALAARVSAAVDEVVKAALAHVKATDGFLSAASPGVISLFFRNDHYRSHEAYLEAIAEAMRHEYETIARAGLIVQIDCPDLAMGRHIQYAGLGL